MLQQDLQLDSFGNDITRNELIEIGRKKVCCGSLPSSKQGAVRNVARPLPCSGCSSSSPIPKQLKSFQKRRSNSISDSTGFLPSLRVSQSTPIRTPTSAQLTPSQRNSLKKMSSFTSSTASLQSSRQNTPSSSSISVDSALGAVLEEFEDGYSLPKTGYQPPSPTISPVLAPAQEERKIKQRFSMPPLRRQTVPMPAILSGSDEISGVMSPPMTPSTSNPGQSLPDLKESLIWVQQNIRLLSERDKIKSEYDICLQQKVQLEASYENLKEQYDHLFHESVQHRQQLEDQHTEDHASWESINAELREQVAISKGREIALWKELEAWKSRLAFLADELEIRGMGDLIQEAETAAAATHSAENPPNSMDTTTTQTIVMEENKALRAQVAELTRQLAKVQQVPEVNTLPNSESTSVISSSVPLPFSSFPTHTSSPSPQEFASLQATLRRATAERDAWRDVAHNLEKRVVELDGVLSSRASVEVSSILEGRKALDGDRDEVREVVESVEKEKKEKRHSKRLSRNGFVGWATGAI